MNIIKSIDEAIGATPLIELCNFERNNRLDATILAKLERNNPAGSIKDRVAKAMLDDAAAAGLVNEDTVLIEPTSGNTGIGLAAIAASRGMRLIIVMPDTMSVERQLLMKAYGAELVLTPGAKGMQGAVDEAERIHAEIDNSFIPGQFVNPSNPAVHERTTGPEIWEATAGKVDAFVAGVGTGGTLTGVGRYLKKMNPEVKIVAVEPATSPLLSEGRAGRHDLQGIGANFVPETLDTSIFDEVITIENEEAYAAGRELAQKEGLLVGITSGANVAAAAKLAKRPEFAGKTIATVLPDTGERYLTSKMFEAL